MKSLVLLSVLGGTLLHARIGETVQEIQSRHGAGKELAGRQIIFTIENFDVTITFTGNRSSMEVYTPRLGNNEEIRPMTPEDIRLLLELQGQGKAWQKMEEESNGKALWLSADGKLYARFLSKYSSLTFAAALKQLPQ